MVRNYSTHVCTGNFLKRVRVIMGDPLIPRRLPKFVLLWQIAKAQQGSHGST